MAKLPENIRKPGGGLVSSKRPHGPRLLLPAEVELCKLLNLTEEEYWYFVDTTAAYNGTRPKGYELIPDIRCDPVTTWLAANIVNIGIAVAAAAVSYLLTPKPKEQKQGGSKRTADSIGNKRFAPQAAFDSVQELAILGEAIPLIFANTDEKAGYGGIRVNSQLLWSQFLSMGKYQQLKVLALFSLGEIPTQVGGVSHPNYEGFGIGDTLLNTYNSHKVGLYFRNGKSYIDDDAKESNRVKKSERYSASNLIATYDDPFIVEVPNKSGGTNSSFDKNKAFSGARNPSTQITFGVFSPVPNAQVAKLPYELCVAVRGTSKTAGWDLMRKRKKIEYAHWPTRAGIIKVTRGGSVLPRTTTAPVDGLVGDLVDYQITGIAPDGEANAKQMKFDTNPNTPGYQEDPTSTVNYDAWGYKPHGVDDVDSMTISIRENADNLFAKGEQYLFGTAVMKCISIPDPVPYEIGKGKSYHFEIIEAGKIDIPVSGADLGTHCNNPDWHDPGSSLNRDERYSLSDSTPILYKQIISGVENYGRGQNDLYYGHDIYTCQRVAFGTVSNNRNCDVTEIGIKSKVYKQMRFANVNSQPGQKALDRAYADRTQVQLGQIDRFLPRMSFFMLQVRKIGQTVWHDMKNGVTSNHTGLFAIRGNSPEFQYNSISIEQERGQFEYRFKPYPGNYFTRGGNFNKQVNVLEPTTDDTTGTQQHFSTIISGVGGFNVLFTGNEAKTIEEDDVYISNSEWNIEPSTRLRNGLVQSAKNNNKNEWKNDSNFNGTDSVQRWVKVVEDDPSEHRRIAYWDPTTNSYVEAGKYHWVMYYDGTEIDAKQTAGGDPGPGVGNWQRVYFLYNGKLFTASQNTAGGHPENKYYLFYVDEWHWQTIEPTPFFEGTVDIVFGQTIGESSYVGHGVAGTLKVDLKVYRDNTDANNIKYHAKWTVNPTHRGTNFDTEYGQQGLYIPKTVSGTTILPEPIQVQIQVGQAEIPVAGKDLNRFDVIKDWNIYEGDVNSNKNEPEHQICFVNEIVKTESDAASAKYLDLAHAGLVINSSKEWTNFSQFSAYFKKGIEIERLITSGTGSSNLFPEIAHALLTSTKIGAGKLVGTVSVDKDSMTDAARFCKANDFFWDGVISSKLNLRDFIFEQANYCLLDFTIIGGKFSLKPTVPVTGSFEIDKNKKPDIKCLFTDGNINDLQVSFLSPEERQLFRAAVLFRKESVNGFPETKSVLVTSDFSTVADPIETFDMSGFCTSSKQAITFAKYAINLRRLSDHGISFKTAPQYIQHLGPGDYFRLVSEVTHTTRFKNGAKLEDGTIVSKDDMTGNEDVLYWMPGTEGEILPSKLSAAPAGCLFTVKNATTENKVYKCETISYAEDGLIEVSGSYAPTEANTGYLSVLQNWDSQFTVQED
jgi:hypothetical protein